MSTAGLFMYLRVKSVERDAVCFLRFSLLSFCLDIYCFCVPACLVAHNCCEVVSVTLCSATRDICGGSGDLQGRPVRVAPLAENRFGFVQDLAFDMAQFLVSIRFSSTTSKRKPLVVHDDEQNTFLSLKALKYDCHDVFGVFSLHPFLPISSKLRFLSDFFP